MQEPSGSQTDIPSAVDARREETRITTTQDGRSPPKGRPGPKPRGRTVVPLTITVTHAQRAALETLADAEKSSISTVVRRFVTVGLAAGGQFGLFVVAALIASTIAHHILCGECNCCEQRSVHHAATRNTD